MAAPKKALWQSYPKLDELRALPAYLAGRRYGTKVPDIEGTDEERAAYALGRDEWIMTRNFNRAAGFDRIMRRRK